MSKQVNFLVEMSSQVNYLVKVSNMLIICLKCLLG